MTGGALIFLAMALPLATAQASTTNGFSSSTEASQAGVIGVAYPWLAAVQYAGTLFCTGTLIAPRIVLTTAHCLEELPDPQTFQVVINPQISGIPPEGQVPPPQPVAVAGYVWHELYSNATLEHDLALLLLDRTVCAPPIVLAEEVPLPGDTLTMVGWWDETHVKDPEVKVIDFDACQVIHGNQDLPPFTICASHPPPASSPSWGSAGAPLLSAGLSNISAFVDTQYGVLSWGAEQRAGSTNRPDVYTSVPEHLDWIEKNSNLLIDFGLPSTVSVVCGEES